jgi:hypothetical protein
MSRVWGKVAAREKSTGMQVSFFAGRWACS